MKKTETRKKKRKEPLIQRLEKLETVLIETANALRCEEIWKKVENIDRTVNSRLEIIRDLRVKVKALEEKQKSHYALVDAKDQRFPKLQNRVKKLETAVNGLRASRLNKIFRIFRRQK